MTTPAALGQHPLDVHEAYEALARYARDYGRAPLLLVMHAAVPETLRPDLLNLIRVNFLAAQGADPSLEADVLFAPFTTALGGGYYRIDPQVRWHALALLRSLYRHDARPRPRRIAELLWRYVEARQHQASRAADPQLAEFLDIQRWVALAFLDPTGAARAFADALQQAGHASGSVALRLGGLASAIELPLSGQPELIAYARGLDALAGGNDADAERLLGALGDGELRIGDVVLRAPTAVLAEGKGQTATADAPPKRRCLVIIGRGVKVDPTTGRGLDLDASYLMIRDAVTALGMDCRRREDLPGGGSDMKDVFREILNADLVICDLSTEDAGVAYLFGVATALRKSGALPVADTGIWQAMGGLLDSRVFIQYQHGGMNIERSEAIDFSKKLVDILKDSSLYPPGVKLEKHYPLALRSTIYMVDPSLAPPYFDENIKNGANPDPDETNSCLLIKGMHAQLDRSSGRELNLEAVNGVIRNALGAQNLHGVMPDFAFDGTWAIDYTALDSFRRAPYAIFDISTLPVNVLIVLGVRHGLRPSRTLLIAEEQTQLPPELAALRILRYKHLGSDIGAAEARRLKAAIVYWLKASPTVDSPVYAALP
ncbi:MAG TPA: hypothetical protein PKC56_16215, partial [Rhodocyclaceae bacterium]|nr:hypothetical protein [Rhodocyclaceae bacterium]